MYGNTYEVLENYKRLYDGSYENSNRWKVYVRLSNKQIDMSKLIDEVRFETDYAYEDKNLSKTRPPFEFHYYGYTAFKFCIIIKWKEWMDKLPTKTNFRPYLHPGGLEKSFVININKKTFRKHHGPVKKQFDIQKLIRLKEIG